MRTTLNLNDEVINELLRETKAKTKTKAVTTALKEFIHKKRIEELKSLSGKLHINTNWRKLEKLELKEP